MRTVNLVATADMIQRYFPEAREPRPAAKPGVMSADFSISPNACTTALGRWLAGVIGSTRFDDDAATCRVVLPATEQGLHFRGLGERLMRRQEIRTPEEAERVFAEIEAWVAEQRKVAKVYGASTCEYRTIQFQWPVFGSAAAQGAETPEAYFDLCASQIRATGGAIVAAGLERATPPESLVRTMAPKSGGGDALLRRYREAVRACRALEHDPQGT